MMDKPWRIEVLGGLKISYKGTQIASAVTRPKCIALLGYLVCSDRSIHQVFDERESDAHISREQICRVLWGDTSEQDRKSLNTHLKFLTEDILAGELGELYDTPSDFVQERGKLTLQINSDAASTDLRDFLLTLACASQPDTKNRLAVYVRALSMYAPFLPMLKEQAHQSLTHLHDPTAEWIAKIRSTLDQKYKDGCKALISLIHQFRENEFWSDEQICAHARETMDVSSLPRHIDPTKYIEHGVKWLEQFLTDALALHCEDSSEQEEVNPLLEISRLRLSKVHVYHVPYFGRKDDLRKLAELVKPIASTNTIEAAEHIRRRLITIHGLGGLGKTRLAMLVAEEVFTAYNGEVWPISLLGVADPRDLWREISEQIHLSIQGSINLTTHLTVRFQQAPLLLLLDNAEQLTKQAAVELAELIECCPQLVCLVTARMPLNVDIEQAYPLHPLSLPSEKATMEEASEFACVKLFVERAQAGMPEFTLTAENIQQIVEICRYLDGFPFAIQIAAAQITHLHTPTAILRHFLQKSALLMQDTVDLESRHRSLHVCFQGSYDLLPIPVRSFFANLSVFRGGWTLEAASEICNEDEAPAYLKMIAKLQLISSQIIDAEVRYTMLETVREFADLCLTENCRKFTQQYHAEYYASFTTKAAQQLNGPNQVRWLDRLDVEAANCFAALQWHVQAHGSVAAIQMSVELSSFWQIRGHVIRGRELLEQIVAIPAAESSPNELAKAIATLVRFCLDSNDYVAAKKWEDACVNILQRYSCKNSTLAYCLLHLAGIKKVDGNYQEAKQEVEESLKLYRQQDDKEGEANCLKMLGILAHRSGNSDAAIQYFETSRACYEMLGDLRGTSDCDCDLGFTKYESGNYEDAQARIQASYQVRQRLNNKRGMTDCLIHLSNIARQQKNIPLAISLLTDALELASRVGPTSNTAHIYNSSGNVAFSQGDHHKAYDYYEKSLALFQKIMDTESIASVLYNKAMALMWLAKSNQGYEEAYRLAEESLSYRRKLGKPLAIGQSLMEFGNIASRQARFTEAENLYLQALRYYRDAGNLLHVTSALNDLAMAIADCKDFKRAARLLGVVEAHQHRVSLEWFPFEQQVRDQKIATIFSSSETREILTEWERGKIMTLDEALIYVLDDPSHQVA